MDAGEMMSLGEICRTVGETGMRLVEITGGEPLVQPRTPELCGKLLDSGYEVMVETNGSLDISVLPKEVHRIVDIKCPGSGACGSFVEENIKHLNGNDEVKFVLASLDDAAWARDFSEECALTEKCSVTFTPVSRNLAYEKLADWMVENRLKDIRFGPQLHKDIWGDKRGV